MLNIFDTTVLWSRKETKIKRRVFIFIVLLINIKANTQLTTSVNSERDKLYEVF